MPKTVCQSVAWFKRYKTLKSVTVGRSVGRSVGRVAQLEKILIFSENPWMLSLAIKIRKQLLILKDPRHYET